MDVDLRFKSRQLWFVKRVHLLIRGRVQGVFFRANTQKEATRLGLQGWVRNTPDGGVEVIAQGKDETLREFILWCRKGPPSALVQDVDTAWEQVSVLPQGFYIRY